MQGAGLFSKLSGYVKGAGGAMGRMHAATGRSLGGGGRAMAYGVGVGGMYGAMSSDTSVIGGMAMGATLGLGARYGKAGYRGGSQYMKNMGANVTYGGMALNARTAVGSRMSRDYSGALLRANKAGNAIKGLFTK